MIIYIGLFQIIIGMFQNNYIADLSISYLNMQVHKYINNDII